MRGVGLMKVLKWIVIVIVLLFMLPMGVAAPFAFIGTAVFLVGLYLVSQKKKGNVIVKKPSWIVALGVVVFLILGISTVDTTETATEDNETKVTTTTVKEETTEKEEVKETADKEAEEKAK